MKRKQVDETKLDLGIYKCEIEHWHRDITQIHKAELKLVDEDDVTWRFADDNSELSYDWHVVKATLCEKQ